MIIVCSGISYLYGFSNIYIDSYDNDKIQTFDIVFNQSKEIESLNKLTEINQSETNFGDFGAINALIASTWQSLKLLPKTLNFMKEPIIGISTIFTIPQWITGFIITIIGIVIIFALWDAFFGGTTR